MHPHEQEELDHQAFAYRNEFEAAYDLSRRERASRPDGSAEIAAVVAAGRFAVVVEVPEFCRFTDALLGSGRYLDSDHATRAEADAAAAARIERFGGDGETSFHVEPAAPRAAWPEPAAEDDDAIPF